MVAVSFWLQKNPPHGGLGARRGLRALLDEKIGYGVLVVIHDAEEQYVPAVTRVSRSDNA